MLVNNIFCYLCITVFGGAYIEHKDIFYNPNGAELHFQSDRIFYFKNFKYDFRKQSQTSFCLLSNFR